MRHIIKLLDVKEWGKISPLVVVDYSETASARTGL
jgi:hypothetical protein